MTRHNFDRSNTAVVFQIAGLVIVTALVLGSLHFSMNPRAAATAAAQVDAGTGTPLDHPALPQP